MNSNLKPRGIFKKHLKQYIFMVALVGGLLNASVSSAQAGLGTALRFKIYEQSFKDASEITDLAVLFPKREKSSGYSWSCSEISASSEFQFEARQKDVYLFSQPYVWENKVISLLEPQKPTYVLTPLGLVAEINSVVRAKIKVNTDGDLLVETRTKEEVITYRRCSKFAADLRSLLVNWRNKLDAFYEFDYPAFIKHNLEARNSKEFIQCLKSNDEDACLAAIDVIERAQQLKNREAEYKAQRQAAFELSSWAFKQSVKKRKDFAEKNASSFNETVQAAAELHLGSSATQNYLLFDHLGENLECTQKLKGRSHGDEYSAYPACLLDTGAIQALELSKRLKLFEAELDREFTDIMMKLEIENF